MRRTVVSLLALSAVFASGVSLSRVAIAQRPPAASSELREEDRNASPLPPGRHAALVKKVCVDCHGGKVIVDLRYSKEDAERFYKNMVSSDLTTEQAQKIVEYLTTTLGQ